MHDPRRGVLLVLDADFGSRLKTVDDLTPIWIINSSENAKYWEPHAHPAGSALFNATGQTLGETLVAILNDVDLHFGAYSSPDPYVVIRVIGLTLSQELTHSLKAHGFYAIRKRADGFDVSAPEQSR